MRQNNKKSCESTWV